MFEYSDTFWIGIHLLDSYKPWLVRIDLRKVSEGLTMNMLKVHKEIRPSVAYSSGLPDRDIMLGKFVSGHTNQLFMNITLRHTHYKRFPILTPEDIFLTAKAIGYGKDLNGVCHGYPVYFQWDTPASDANWRLQNPVKIPTGWLVR